MNTAHASGPGAPNKLCDLIAAAISEEYQKRDSSALTDIRVSGGRGALFVTGLVRSTADFEVATLVKQLLGKVDPSLGLEPFIAIDAAGGLKRPAVQTVGYATDASPLFLPKAAEISIGIARQLENARQGSDGWFWLSPDFDVTVREAAGKMEALIHVSHIDTVTIEQVREQVCALFHDHIERVQVNMAGADRGNGLAGNIGSSGQDRLEWYGTTLPASSCVAGAELAHPANIGWMIARHVAKRLVLQGAGHAVMVDLAWEPLADIPTMVHARNEQGKNISSLIIRESLSRKRLAEKWALANLMSHRYKFSFDGAIDLPFEQTDFLI